MKILVFGASGFVGRHVADCLLQHHEVVGVSRTVSEKSKHVDTADLTNPGDVKRVIQAHKPEVIVNCAGLFARDQDVSLNKVFTANILDAAHEVGGVRRLVICSSAAVYGEVTDWKRPIMEDDPLRGTSDYALSKIDEEHVAHTKGKGYNIETVAARIFNAIGPDANTKLLAPNILRQVRDVRAGVNNEVHVSRLDAMRDFIDIADVVRAFELLTTEKLKHDTYNIGSGHTVTIGDFVEEMCEVIAPGKHPSIVESSEKPEPLLACRADTSRLFAEFRWQAKIPLQETIKEMNHA